MMVRFTPWAAIGTVPRSEWRTVGGLGDEYDLRVALEVAEDLLAEGMGDLGVDAGVLDIAVPKMVSHVFDVAAGIEKMYGDRMPEGMD